MSSVSTSDGGYTYYQRTIGELEDELQNEARRSREREELRAQRLEDNYKEELASRDRELEDTIVEIRKNANRTISDERANAKAEVDELKSKTYDRSGRYLTDANTLKRELDDMANTTELIAKREATRAQEAERDYEERSEALHREYQKKVEDAVRDTKESIFNTTGRSAEDRNREIEDNKAEVAKKYQEMDRERIEDINFQRRQFAKGMVAAEKDFEHRTKGIVEAAEKGVRTGREADRKKLEETTARINDSHKGESAQLRAQIKDLVHAEKDFVKGRAQGTEQAVKEYENEWRDRVNIAANTFEQELSAVKKHAEESESHLGRLNNDNLREKDIYFSRLLAKQGNENRMMQKQVQDTFNRDREQIEKKMVTERSQAKKQLDTELKDADRLRASALENQAKTYQDTMLRQRTSSAEQMDKLERQLRDRQTSGDTSEISPAAEASVRKSITNEYEKQFGAERERNKRGTESIQKEYSGRMREAIAQVNSEKTQVTRRHEAERNYERLQFLDHLTDTVEDKKSAIHHKEIESQRQAQNADRNFSSFVEKQRREYEDLLQMTKEDGSTRIQATRQEAEFKQKMMQREFANQQNEIAREFDKRMTDQKQEYDFKIDEMRTQNQLSMRDAERRFRGTLEEQERVYEQRLSQLEASHKERERYITQNFEENLDKVKRSHALLSRKKS